MSDNQDRANAARAHANDLFAQAHEAAQEAERLEAEAADGGNDSAPEDAVADAASEEQGE